MNRFVLVKAHFPMCLLAFIVVMQSPTNVFAGDNKGFRLGIQSQRALLSPILAANPKIPTMGLFFDYRLSRRLDLEVEFNKKEFLADESTFLDSGFRREWSLSLALQYELSPLVDRIKPYLAAGAGNYYVCSSKKIIREGRQHPQERGLDYDMREFLRRSGVFGAVGLQFQAQSRVDIFVQTKCSILFDNHDLAIEPSAKFTDFINISTGLKFRIN